MQRMLAIRDSGCVQIAPGLKGQGAAPILSGQLREIRFCGHLAPLPFNRKEAPQQRSLLISTTRIGTVGRSQVHCLPSDHTFGKPCIDALGLCFMPALQPFITQQGHAQHAAERAP